MKTFPNIGLAIVLILIVGLASPANSAADDQQQIMNREKQEEAAIATGNLDALMSIYTQDKNLIAFDEEAPFEYVGIDAWRNSWRNAWPDSKSNVARQKLSWSQAPRIVVSDGIAVEIGIAHWTTVYKDGHQVEYDYRLTQCWRREGGEWRIFHAHYSVPFDVATGKAVFEAKP